MQPTTVGVNMEDVETPSGEMLYEFFWKLIRSKGSMLQPVSLLLEVEKALRMQNYKGPMPQHSVDLKTMDEAARKIVFEYLCSRSSSVPTMDEEKFKKLLNTLLGGKTTGT